MKRGMRYLLTLAIILTGGTALLQAQTITVNRPDSLVLLSETLFRGVVDAESSDGATIDYQVIDGPDGFSIDALSGEMLWFPTTPGTYSITLRLTHSINRSISLDHTFSTRIVDKGKIYGCNSADRWVSLGDPLPGQAFGASEKDGNLYVYHTNFDDYRDNPGEVTLKHSVSVWDGNEWTEMWSHTPVYLGGLAPLSYGDDLFLVNFEHGMVPIIDTVTSGMYKWNGTTFAPVEEFLSDNVVAVQEYRGELYVILNEYSYPKKNFRLVRYDGSTWTTVADSRKRDAAFHDLALYEGELIMSCDVGAVGMVSDSVTLVEVHGDRLDPVSNDPKRAAQAIVAHEEKLVLDFNPADAELHTWTESGLQSLPDIPRQLEISSPLRNDISTYIDKIVSRENELIVMLQSDQYPSHSEFWRYVDGEWEQLPAILTSRFYGMVKYGDNLLVLGAYSQSCDNDISPVSRLCGEGDCEKVSGTIYHDQDGDCLQGTGEPGVSGYRVEFQPGGYFATTRSDGSFGLFLPDGRYEAALVYRRHWYTDCDRAQTVVVDGGSISGVDFGVDYLAGIKDIEVSLVPSLARPGRPLHYVLTYRNVGTAPASGTIFFGNDSDREILDVAPAADRESSGRLEWDFTDLPVGEGRVATIVVEVSPTAPRGELICAVAEVEIDDASDHTYPYDDRDSTCVTIRASYDPNDLRVTPDYEDAETSFSQLRENDTTLTYLVRFQNTGNDTAFTVVVRDTLSPELFDVGTVTPLASSHPYEFTLSGQGALAFRFNNILLPDSTTNGDGSHGTFKFSVRIRDDIAGGTPLKNRVAIYFDHNDPVYTNEVLSVTAKTSSVGNERHAESATTIFPNPASGASRLTFVLSEKSYVRVALLDSRGAESGLMVNQRLGKGEHTLELPIIHLSPGAYFVAVEIDGTREIVPLIVR